MAENVLGRESSPYLLQHAGNPVHWYPWGEEALARARRENLPIFLSIGYSACHWCHVMAHESFENPDIAEVMNEHFVNIKVDREERPDIDAIYQTACQRATGQGGWPLSVFLTPDQKPFYVGTYFPALDAHGRPGFGGILRHLAQAWHEKPSAVKKAAEDFATNLEMAPPAADPVEIERPLLDEAAVNLLQLGDPSYGGFGSAPKFPNAANISFMFRYARLSGVSRFGEFALRTLAKMAKGGIFDQIGGGFHRYSTDNRWLVPHFEKMLYDNALIPINYAEAYQITHDGFYLGIMAKTLDFVLREMTSPEGAFYSALDADSEGEEGKFYVWSKSEIRDVLGDDADLFCLYYDVTDGGNWEGKCILCNNLNISAVAFSCSIPEGEARRIIKKCEEKLLIARDGRVRPGLDDKVLASWNAMMITALARGHRVSGDGRYLEAARRAADFIIREMVDGDVLFHTYKDGARIRGFLEDYACMTGALLDVFEECADRRYLDAASRLGAYMLDHFWDGRDGFYMTPDDHEPLILRPDSEHDLSTPSGNSVAAMSLIRLNRLTGKAAFLEPALATIKSRLQKAAENPFAFGHLLNAAYLQMRGATEVTILNAENREVQEMLSTEFIPEGMLVFINDRGQAEDLAEYPFFAGKAFGDRTRVFVCRNMACSPPLSTVQEIKDSLDLSKLRG